MSPTIHVNRSASNNKSINMSFSSSVASAVASIQTERGEVAGERSTRKRQRITSNSSGVNGSIHGRIHGCLVIAEVVCCHIRRPVDMIWGQQVTWCRQHHRPVGGRRLLGNNTTNTNDNNLLRVKHQLWALRYHTNDFHIHALPTVTMCHTVIVIVKHRRLGWNWTFNTVTIGHDLPK